MSKSTTGLTCPYIINYITNIQVSRDHEILVKNKRVVYNASIN